MAGEIIHLDDVAVFQDGSQLLLNPGPEQRTIDGTVDGPLAVMIWIYRILNLFQGAKKKHNRVRR
jgi:hypothetical protein